MHSSPIDRVVDVIADANKTLRKVGGGVSDAAHSAARLPHTIADKVSWAFLGKHI